MSLWITIIAAGLITYLIRLSFIAILHRWNAPAWFRQSLRYVPPAVLSAIVAPELLYRDSRFTLALANHELLAGLVAIVVAWRTRSAVLTILAGMGALFLLRALLP